MIDQNWFSAKLRFVLLVEPTGGDIVNDCVFLVRARDFQDAFGRAIEIGKGKENEYKNSSGMHIVKRLMEVVTLDILPSQNLDGVEVYSEIIHLAIEKISFSAKFSPEGSKPIQTI